MLRTKQRRKQTREENLLHSFTTQLIEKRRGSPGFMVVAAECALVAPCKPKGATDCITSITYLSVNRV